MSKGDTPRKMLVSQEEYDLRWKFMRKEVDMTYTEFLAEVQEIRKRTGKP